MRRAMMDTAAKTHLLVYTEHYLIKWLVRRLRENLSEDGQKGVTNPEPFNALRRWLYSFKKQCDVKFAIYQGEIASAYITAANEFPAVAKQIIEEGNLVFIGRNLRNCCIYGVE